MIASRTPAGLTFLAGDHQNTSMFSFPATGTTQPVTVRRQTPYGSVRGPAPAWPNTRGFVGGTVDNTGLTHLGAREYDPAVGRFISVDPVMDLTSPQQMHGYSYANGSPVTMNDPTGLDPGGGQCVDEGRCSRYPKPPPGGTSRNPHRDGGGSSGSESRSPTREPPPPSCRQFREYCHRPGQNRLNPYQLGLRWLSEQTLTCDLKPFSGTGPPCSTEFFFRDGDPFTESLKELDVVADKRAEIRAAILRGHQMTGSADVHYIEWSAGRRVKQIISDMFGVLTKGVLGSDPSQAFVGSFDLDWEIIGHDKKDNPVIEYNLRNASTRSSATTNPAGKYPDGGGSAARGSNEPDEWYQMQSVRWRETMKFHEVPSVGVEMWIFVDTAGKLQRGDP